jgi:hypothetical protein
MILKTLLLTFTLLFTACGGGGDNTDRETQTNLNTFQEKGTTETTTNPKQVTIYVHGYDKNGYKRDGVYGNINSDTILDTIVEFTGLPTMQNYDENYTNVLAITPYYGNQPPSYYTQQDTDEVNSKEGIPRYATIIAKFAKHVLAETKAEKLNIVSASMGSLVTRWVIEKDLENLASNKKIKSWLSIEGVIRGNHLASKDGLMSLVNIFQKQPIETKHMTYDWINQNLGGTEATNQNYNDIELGFISSTNSKEYKLKPNDGVQLVEDTIFSKTPNHDPIYEEYFVSHKGIEDDDGAWASVATFLSQNRKRVKITLTKAEVFDLHEHNYELNSDSEIVFQTKVISQKANETYNIDDDISERALEGGTLNLITYKNINETKSVNQTIFNNYVLADERELTLKIEGFEIDKLVVYGVTEPTDESSTSSLGEASLVVPLKDGVYDISAKDWSGKVKVEVLP